MSPVLLHDLLASAAERDPAALAVADGEHSITYGELHEQARRTACLLVDDCAVERGGRIGIYAEKSIETVVTIYATMMAGAAYVPIDPTAPAARTAAIIEDCGIRVLASPSRLKKSWVSLHASGASLDHIVALDAQPGMAVPEPLSSTLHSAASLASSAERTTPARVKIGRAHV